jgi:hypothetical protein
MELFAFIKSTFSKIAVGFRQELLSDNYRLLHILNFMPPVQSDIDMPPYKN